MGLGKWAEAQLRRQDADRFRHTLLTLATSARESESMSTLVAGSRIDERIAVLQGDAAQLESELAEERRALAVLDERLEDLEARWEAARSRRAEALAALDALKAEGVDFSDPEGSERFRVRLEELDAAFRAADREVRSLEHGDYLNAQIDRSGDFLTGRYVEVGSTEDPAFEHGVTHFRGQRAVAAKQVEGKEQVLREVQADTAHLEGMKSDYTKAQAQAVNRINECAVAAAESYEELSRVESEAFAIEDEALALLERSGKASQQAAGYARQWISDARDRTEGLSSEVKERSAFGSRLQDTWMGGYIAAQEADVRLAKAWIYYERYTSATQNGRILSIVTDALPLQEADPESEHAKSSEAHDAGVEEITRAVTLLERAHNDTNRHWTVAAQAAGTTYLMALFGHEDYVADAIEGYRNAVKGREDEKSAEAFVARLNRLEAGGDLEDEEPASSAPPAPAEP
jgi:flagellar biosynthesis chaperone FliJ